MEANTAAARQQIDRNGFAISAAVFTSREIEQLQSELARALSDPNAALIQREGMVVGARNLIRYWPRAATVWRRPLLVSLLTEILGSSFGLVRILFFDKPPSQTWSLPWHKDLTIAVRDNRRPSSEFRNPTTKAGVPHVEASRAVLESMLFARIHLEDVTDHNGPMTVIPGSHRSGKSMEIDETRAEKILCGRGDVLLIRPLVAHNSLGSDPGNRDHRRILHLEFAANRELPEAFEWHDFISSVTQTVEESQRQPFSARKAPRER